MHSEAAIFGRELAASVCLAACIAFAARCQEPVPSDAATTARKLEQAWMKVFSKHAEDYKIYPADQPEKPFKFATQPVFRHDAPSRNSDDIGGVWVWTDEDGRPSSAGRPATARVPSCTSFIRSRQSRSKRCGGIATAGVPRKESRSRKSLMRRPLIRRRRNDVCKCGRSPDASAPTRSTTATIDGNYGLSPRRYTSGTPANRANGSGAPSSLFVRTRTLT
jgi:hypothetical protein